MQRTTKVNQLQNMLKKRWMRWNANVHSKVLAKMTALKSATLSTKFTLLHPYFTVYGRHVSVKPFLKLSVFHRKHAGIVCNTNPRSLVVVKNSLVKLRENIKSILTELSDYPSLHRALEMLIKTPLFALTHKMLSQTHHVPIRE